MEPCRIEDLYRHCDIAGIEASIRHDRVAYVRSRADEAGNDYRAVVWSFDRGSHDPPRALTSAESAASSPSLSPDGASLAFLSRRGDDAAQQVYAITVDGGEARRITRADRESISAIEGWSPDGRRLLLSVSVPFAEDDRDDPRQPEGQRPIVARHMPYKQDGAGARVGKRTHLYMVDLDGGDLSPIVEGDCDVSSGRWSPDGERLAYVRTRAGTQRHLRDLWIANADGGDARQVTDALATVQSPRWSPDGASIAFGGSETAGESLSGLWVFDVEEHALRTLGGRDLQLEGGDIAWHPSGERVAVVASVRGMLEIAVVEIDGGGVRHFRRRLRHVLSLGASRDGLVYAAATMRWPVELHVCGWEGENDRRITSANRTWAAARERPRASVRRFDVPDGDGGTERIDAWILRPPGKANGPYPVLMDMHGGPHTVVSIDHASHVYWYALCAMGWMIVAPNAVGSAGYGEDFAKRLRGAWGERDLPQYLAILDALREDGLVDRRVACTGKSYGGFLAAWAVGNSRAFRAAAISAPVANVESHGGTSDTGFYVTPYAMGAEIDEDKRRYHRLSPVAYCVDVDSAVLLLQGQDDQRCPLGQSEELFATLIRHSRMPCEMVVYPGGSHGMAASGNPKHRVDYHQRIVDWMVAHAGGAAD